MIRRSVAVVIVVAVWLGLVNYLPRVPGNYLGTAGLFVGAVFYIRWLSRHPERNERPKWGCFLSVPVARFRIQVQPNGDSRAFAYRERMTLLRAALPESHHEDDLLRPAAGTADADSDDLLRSSETLE